MQLALNVQTLKMHGLFGFCYHVLEDYCKDVDSSTIIPTEIEATTYSTVVTLRDQLATSLPFLRNPIARNAYYLCLGRYNNRNREEIAKGTTKDLPPYFVAILLQRSDTTIAPDILSSIVQQYCQYPDQSLVRNCFKIAATVQRLLTTTSVVHHTKRKRK